MELSLMNLTLILTLIWSVEVGVLSSIALSLLLVVKKSSQTRMSILVSLLLFFLRTYKSNAAALGSDAEHRPMEADQREP